MVSFSCEACGDVLTKKKLDPHRNQCRGASYTCIDCMVHFQGTSYRSHTSCMSEAQKYQGALYREKPAKNQRKGQNNGRQNQNQNQNQQQNQNQKQTPHGHRAPYVEDGTDTDNLPPPAPSPPPAGVEKTPRAEGKTDKPVNVFDYLVPEGTPNASKVSVNEAKEQMKMVANAPSVFESSKSLARVDTDGDDDNKTYDVAYEENGFSYGSGPINQSPYDRKAPNVSMEFMTPAPKKKKDRASKAEGATSEKKRKRRTEDHDTETDTPMLDAPSSVVNHPGTPMLNHSGLTGGLNRMLRSPSLDDEEGHENSSRRRYQETSSPIKRTRRDEKENQADAGLGISMKNRAERFVSSMFGGSSVSGSSANGQLETRRAKKTHKIRENGDAKAAESADARKSKRKSSAQTEGDRPSRRQKQIEYPESHHDEDGRQVTLYPKSTVPDGLQRQMASHFLSLVTKGPESSRGFSVNKVLKRFHKDFTDEFDADRGRDQGRSRADRERRIDDEKELWRTLRLKMNERGEIVVFF
ncbi:LYAR-type C2HC zinc finger protein [Aspergillus fijiensis CBS 313.89]|uniref:Zinc finger C2H2 LYAR-type domain-containing protein n=1 Tax=Aspergillus fijiensis CBS 313.89 TaxID=1448319 RepID=A0A8G1VUC8_9EURO|nr:uncharacterized protein BO72DRAFT_390514 [Aspergillus fijiensis CBS 313.89]RAK72001.1 hypothetical protein BO72DRAFT_390514 [Aspergillus fijiensis CBS 313.89]